jgi:hypothetical protein
LKATLPAIVRGIVSECCTATGGTAAVARTASTPAEAAALAQVQERERCEVHYLPRPAQIRYRYH